MYSFQPPYDSETQKQRLENGIRLFIFCSYQLNTSETNNKITHKTTEDINPRLDQFESFIKILWPLSIFISVIITAVATHFIFKRQMIPFNNHSVTYTVMDSIDSTTTMHQYSQTDSTSYNTREIQTSIRMIPDEPTYASPLPPKKVLCSPPIKFEFPLNQPSTSTKQFPPTN